MNIFKNIPYSEICDFIYTVHIRVDCYYYDFHEEQEIRDLLYVVDSKNKNTKHIRSLAEFDMLLNKDKAFERC